MDKLWDRNPSYISHFLFYEFQRNVLFKTLTGFPPIPTLDVIKPVLSPYIHCDVMRRYFRGLATFLTLLSVQPTLHTLLTRILNLLKNSEL